MGHHCSNETDPSLLSICGGEVPPCDSPAASGPALAPPQIRKTGPFGVTKKARPGVDFRTGQAEVGKSHQRTLRKRPWDRTTGLVGDNPDLTKFNRFYRTMPGPPQAQSRRPQRSPRWGRLSLPRLTSHSSTYEVGLFGHGGKSLFDGIKWNADKVGVTGLPPVRRPDSIMVSRTCDIRDV